MTGIVNNALMQINYERLVAVTHEKRNNCALIKPAILVSHNLPTDGCNNFFIM
jgi:hypothetical protein